MTLWRALNALNVVHTLPKMLEYPAICSRHQTIKDVIVHFAPIDEVEQNHQSQRKTANTQSHIFEFRSVHGHSMVP